MKLYIYRNLNDERVPKDVTHVIVDDSVTIIKKHTFVYCRRLISVIMSDNVKKIEHHAFGYCYLLRFIRLSKSLEFIGGYAFKHCTSLEALFLPSTVTSIEYEAFDGCQSLRLLILPNAIHLNLINVSLRIIHDTAISDIANTTGVVYGWSHESNRKVHKWLSHHMDKAPFHKLCYDSSITTRQINDYLNTNGYNSALATDKIHGMKPLHILTMNPHASAVSIAALLDSNTEAIYCLDNQQKTPLDYARDYNVGGLIGMINVLCNDRNSPTLVGPDTTRKRIGFFHSFSWRKLFLLRFFSHQ